MIRKNQGVKFEDCIKPTYTYKNVTDTKNVVCKDGDETKMYESFEDFEKAKDACSEDENCKSISDWRNARTWDTNATPFYVRCKMGLDGLTPASNISYVYNIVPWDAIIYTYVKEEE